MSLLAEKLPNALPVAEMNNDYFPILATIAGAALLTALVVGSIRHRRSRLPPPNELELLLSRLATNPNLADEFFSRVAAATLIGLESPDAPDEPMDFSARFSPEIGETTGGQRAADGLVEFGPWVVCFTSIRAIAELRARHPEMAPLVTRIGAPRPFSAREIFQTARDRNIEVALNLCCENKFMFGEEEIWSVLAKTGRS